MRKSPIRIGLDQLAWNQPNQNIERQLRTRESIQRGERIGQRDHHLDNIALNRHKNDENRLFKTYLQLHNRSFLEKPGIVSRQWL
ncbi:hypothetical protein [Brevibacillus dissolubilis]|uniref:hypothetical protein n=1 Tax=Brevibacillus dissolubilis TaxID=1844116 RepID=UPI001116E1E9|nr:hypothetical protein [Brevibacillus dissolubilis]